MSRLLMMIAIASSTLALAACGTSGIMQTQQAAPTVSYAYSNAADAEEIEEKANDYCDENYDKDAVLLTRDAEGDNYKATYACQ